MDSIVNDAWHAFERSLLGVGLFPVSGMGVLIRSLIPALLLLAALASVRLRHPGTRGGRRLAFAPIHLTPARVTRRWTPPV